MAEITPITDWRDSEVTEIIDVRSPAEYADDHIPGAINLPVLSNDERAEVGQLHRSDPFNARILGARYITANVSELLKAHGQGKSGRWRPVIYCWRGGQRSNSLATILAQVGWRPFVLAGGYKQFRSVVMAELSSLCERLKPLLLQGATGSGKTRILHAVANAGGQILDLEGLSCHRGSALGHIPEQPQPPQRLFETRVWQQLNGMNMEQPVLIEAESSKIGDRHIPKPLWAVMKTAPQIEITMPIESRCELLLEDYQHLIQSPDVLNQLIDTMRFRLGNQTIGEWKRLVAQKQWHAFVKHLLETHYDQAYAKSAQTQNRTLKLRLSISSYKDLNTDQTISPVLDALQTI